LEQIKQSYLFNISLEDEETQSRCQDWWSSAFVMEVKHVFQDRREKYDEFLKILDDFSVERIDRAAVKEGMTELLKDH